MTTTDKQFMNACDKVLDNPYKQLCVWPGTVLGSNSPEEFEEHMLKEFKARVKFECVVETLPDVKNGKAVPATGGRSDLFFHVHEDDIGHFSIPRLMAGIRWWEDVLGNGGGCLYTDEFLKAHPKTW